MRLPDKTVFQNWGQSSNRIRQLLNCSTTVRRKIVTLFLPLLVLTSFVSGLVLYETVSRSIQENSERMLNGTVKQTGRYLEQQLYDIFGQFVIFSESRALSRVILALANGTDDSGAAARYRNVSNDAEEILRRYDAQLDGVFVSLNDGQFRLLRSGGIVADVSFDFDRWDERLSEVDSGYHWLSDDMNSIVQAREGYPQPGVLLKTVGSAESGVKGIVVFLLRSESFSDTLRSPALPDSGDLVLITGKSSVYEHTKTDQSIELTSDIIREISQSESAVSTHDFTTESEKRVIVASYEMEINGWRVAAVVPRSDLYSEVRDLGAVLLLVVSSTVFLGIMLYNVLAKQVTAPLEHLKAKVDSISAENMDIDFDIVANDEIGALNDGISALVSRMKLLIHKTAENESAKRDAQIEALTAQIRPHFLYNALNSVKHFYAMGEKAEASTMLNALSDFFRYTMEDWKRLSTIGKEVEHAESFLLIERGRHRVRISYYIDVDLDLIDQPVIRIVLQPLVENAIAHGIRNIEGQGRIGIEGYREGEKIVLSVLDNGIGIDANRLNALYSESPESSDGSSSIGLTNLRQRLVAYYGACAELRIGNRTTGGTIVSVVIPIIDSVQEHTGVYRTPS